MPAVVRVLVTRPLALGDGFPPTLPPLDVQVVLFVLAVVVDSRVLMSLAQGWSPPCR